MDFDKNRYVLMRGSDVRSLFSDKDKWDKLDYYRRGHKEYLLEYFKSSVGIHNVVGLCSYNESGDMWETCFFDNLEDIDSDKEYRVEYRLGGRKMYEMGYSTDYIVNVSDKRRVIVGDGIFHDYNKAMAYFDRKVKEFGDLEIDVDLDTIDDVDVVKRVICSRTNDNEIYVTLRCNNNG